MTYLHKEQAKLMENELKMWWTLVSERRAAFRRDPFDPIVEEYRDELEVLHEMTEWPGLKALCGRTLVYDIQKMAHAEAMRFWGEQIDLHWLCPSDVVVAVCAAK
jgi:hypothetical protein